MFFKSTAILFLSLIALFFIIEVVTKDLKCVSQTMYHENSCNYCFCMHGELRYCTLKYCEGFPFYEKAKKCKVNTQWKQGCNQCMCVANYGTLCTYNVCNPNPKQRG